jgi:hypothetical protein
MNTLPESFRDFIRISQGYLRFVQQFHDDHIYSILTQQDTALVQCRPFYRLFVYLFLHLSLEQWVVVDGCLAATRDRGRQ